MKRKFGLTIRLLAPAALCALCLQVSAQQPPKLEPLPDIPPPPALSDVPANKSEPQITVRQDGQNKIEEYRINGRLYAVRVTPPVGKPYTMLDPDGKGVRITADDPSGGRPPPPHWVLFEF
jgi:hypothetical protein